MKTRSLQTQRGVAAIELGILMIVLVPLVFGITEFGRAIYQINTIAKSTRDAARFLSSQGPGDPADLTVAKNLTVFGSKTDSMPGIQPVPRTPLVPNLTTDMVTVCDSASPPPCNHLNIATGSGVINIVTVTVSGYSFTSLVPFVVPNIPFTPISTTMRQ